MAECIKCGEYTKFNGGLCSKCYAEKKMENTTGKSYVMEGKVPPVPSAHNLK